MADKELPIKLLLDDKEALSKLKKAMASIEDESKKATDSANISWAGLASKFYLVEQAARPVIQFMQSAVKAAMEQEDAIKRLNYALDLQGVNVKSVSDKYQKMADALQRSTRFSDDSIMSVQQTLVTLGNVAPAQMERAVQAVLDFSAATGTSLDAASTLFAKAFAGNTSSLSRYGIVIDETIPKANRLEAVLQLVNDRMGGSAQVDAQTAAGQLSLLKNSYDDLLEELGGLITKSPTVKMSLDAINKGLQDMAEAMKKIREANPDAVGDIIQKIGLMVPSGILARIAGAIAGGANTPETLAAAVFGTPAQNKTLTEEVQTILNEAAQRAVAAYEELQAKNKATVQRTMDFFKSMEDLKLESVIGNTDIIKRLKEEETLQFIEAERTKLLAAIASDETQRSSKQRLLEVYVALGQAKDAIQNPVNKADQEEQARLAEMFTVTENMKLSTLIQSTEIADQIRQQSTLRTLDLAQKELLAKKQLSDAELNQLKAIEQARAKITQASALARFETQKTYALASADLLDAVSVASGKGMLKGVAIVLRAVVTAVDVMMTTVNPFLALLKIAVTAVSAANAIAALGEAERALDASRNQSIQAVTNVPGLASGGRVSGAGAVLVGESGPELLNLPRGAQVTPLDRTAGAQYSINIVINNPVFDPGDLSDQLAAQIGPKISRFIDDERGRL